MNRSRLPALVAIIALSGCDSAVEEAPPGAPQEAFNALSTCLVGGPLPEGESATQRLRAIELAEDVGLMRHRRRWRPADSFANHTPPARWPNR